MKSYVLKLALVYVVAMTAILMGGVIECSFYATTVTVTLQEGAEEPRDLGLPGDGDSAPDYNLCVLYRGGWETCATYENTPIGSGLTWEIPEDAPPLKHLVRYQFAEEDPIMNDALEWVRADEAEVVGERFAFRRNSTFNIIAGFRWFVARELWDMVKFMAAISFIVGGFMVSLGLSVRVWIEGGAR